MNQQMINDQFQEYFNRLNVVYTGNFITGPKIISMEVIEADE